jgi:hypothetical protein
VECTSNDCVEKVECSLKNDCEVSVEKVVCEVPSDVEN